jgi:transcriptional regulator with XRE-family HTH domain
MTGNELRAARERLGAPIADLAARAGVAADVLSGWEASGVPRAAARKLAVALWELERDAALAKSGLPACEWVARFAALPDGPGKDPWTLEQHIGSCPACQARGRYVERNVRPRPEHSWLAWLPPLPRAVLAGAALALVVSGGAVAALILLLLGIAGQDANLLVGAAGLFAACAAAGGAGGAVHHLTRPWRRGGAVGHYASWVMTIELALALGLGLVVLAAWRGWAGLGPDEFRAVTHPVLIAAAAAAGVLVALAVGARAKR